MHTTYTTSGTWYASTSLQPVHTLRDERRTKIIRLVQDVCIDEILLAVLISPQQRVICAAIPRLLRPSVPANIGEE